MQMYCHWFLLHVMLTSGAVVAREYGLPCIVGATGATSILRFGDTITLNAGKGVIVSVEENKGGAV